MITALFDDLCPICSREVQYYQRHLPAAAVKWIALSRVGDVSAEYNLSRRDALTFFHARDANGPWRVGLDGFALIWRHMRYWRWLARLVTMPGLRGLLALIYRRYALRRFKRLQHCRECKD